MKSSTATATTATGKTGYVGRFAPSPTGDLHLGSLLTAVASYLDARANGGLWLLRVEDLDREREVPGAAGRILEALESFGLRWDGPVVYQSTRRALYDAALARLARSDHLFECRCSRRQLRDEQHYPGTCRRHPPPAATPTATRFKVEPGTVEFDDLVQGHVRLDPARLDGDFVVRRRDGIVAYALAVVVDDAAQRVTHVVRGADLLERTPGQILLQRALGLPEPVYAHVPVLTEPTGAKLSKSRRSPALASDTLAAQLCEMAAILGMDPPACLGAGSVNEFWDWAVPAWDLKKVPKRREVPLN